MFVLIGVAGEGVELIAKICFRHRSEKFDSLLDRIGFAFWALVVLGLVMEFNEAAKTDRDFSTMTVLAAQIGTTNAQLVASNLVNKAIIEQVRSNNNVLAMQLDDSIKARLEIEMSLLPRTLKNRDESIERLKAYAGTKFIVFCAPSADKECRDLAISISFVLTESSWVFIPKDFAIN